MKKFFLFGIALGLILLSCQEQRYSWEIDDEKIRNYLNDKGLSETAVKHSYGFYYIIEEEGTGKRPNASSYIKVTYTGYYTNDSVFDSGTERFNLSSLYRGWQYGIPLFKEGGKGQLFLPRDMADGISVMIFDVELHNVW